MVRLAKYHVSMVALLLCAGAIAPLRAEDATPLIPRTALFGNPTKARAQVSPDGH